jgi:hypothetical protein
MNKMDLSTKYRQKHEPHLRNAVDVHLRSKMRGDGKRLHVSRTGNALIIYGNILLSRSLHGTTPTITVLFA